MASNERGMSITRATGTGIPVRGNDIDTDQILPARFLKEVTFDRMGEYAFYDQRRDEHGNFNDHPFNKYDGAGILVVNKNFGCGSSREHAPQALMRWGVNGIVGESFAEIFRDNCKSLGIPTVTADESAVTALQDWIEENPDAGIEIDVVNKKVKYDDRVVNAAMPDSTKEALAEGIWDTTELLQSNMSSVHSLAESLSFADR
ncbi:3-isopropylmalate dehydratase small subunit [Halosegnis longus]|uniref:3-isopropylmalate dehydratase small subunit n=1 Tax=Halosegnis longus TaxID=2216012 RepID=A0AAJ4R5R4_9EURY|nr:3-isopropylmalate dehydratase small subunit [Salella cibi]